MFSVGVLVQVCRAKVRCSIRCKSCPGKGRPGRVATHYPAHGASREWTKWRSEGKEEFASAEAEVARAAGEMGRALDTEGLKEVLYRNLESPRWEQIAERCLSCGNCTMVCPTCFCTTVEDTTDLAGQRAERWRIADSCFVDGFAYIHGGSIRSSTMSRYRQWMTHKLATWEDQFGRFMRDLAEQNSGLFTEVR